jgi:prepilin-type N-terminal cleavage/methylation domain-containing protein
MPFSPQPKSIKLDRALVSPGFTLIELIVAIGVVAIIAGITLGSRQNYSRAVNLNNVAHEIALSIRQAQTYGVSSRGSDIGDDISKFSHGIEFDTDAPQQFILYRNTNGNNGYQPDDDLIETYQLPERMEIVAICETLASDQTCASGSRNDIVIMFSRPNPDAAFYRANGGPSLSRSQAAIVIADEDGSRQTIITRSSGFISVE